MNLWKGVFAVLVVFALAVGAGYADSKSRDGSGTNTSTVDWIQVCSTTCLRWEMRITDYRFKRLEEIVQQPNGTWQVRQRFSNANAIQFVVNGPAEWANGQAKFRDIQNAVTNRTIFTAPVSCMPPCNCQLNQPLRAFNTDNKWHKQESSPYAGNLGNPVTLRAVAEIKFEQRLLDGTCSVP